MLLVKRGGVPEKSQEDEVMLILSRKVGQQIRISKDIVVVVRAIEGGRIKIGIEAPKHVQVLRAELSSQLRGLEPTKVINAP